mgnify:FL=1
MRATENQPLVSDELLTELADPTYQQQCGDFDVETCALLAAALPEICTELLLWRQMAASKPVALPMALRSPSNLSSSARQTTKTARSVVTNPEQFHCQPTILACAWDILMTERGKRVDLERLGRPAHIVESAPGNPVTVDSEARAARIRERIRRHVAKSSGGDAA